MRRRRRRSSSAAQVGLTLSLSNGAATDDLAACKHYNQQCFLNPLDLEPIQSVWEGVGKKWTNQICDC